MALIDKVEVPKQPQPIEYNKEEHKTWKYHAENVHDFAFTADPTYRIGESWWEDKVCYSLVQEPHASKWQNAASFGAECLRVFSEDFGRYVWHKVIVADAIVIAVILENVFILFIPYVSVARLLRLYRTDYSATIYAARRSKSFA